MSDRVAAAMAAAEAAAMDSDDEDGGGGGRGFFDGYVRDRYDADDGYDQHDGGYDPERDTSLFDEFDMRALSRESDFQQGANGGGPGGPGFGADTDPRAVALSGFSSADRRPLQQRLEQSRARAQAAGAANVGVAALIARGPSPAASSLLLASGGGGGGRVTPDGSVSSGAAAMHALRVGAATVAAATVDGGSAGGYSTQRFRPPSAGRRAKVGGAGGGAGAGLGTARGVPRANKFKSGRASPLAAAGMTGILAAADAAAERVV